MIAAVANIASGAIKIILVFSAIVALIAFLPDASDHPVPPEVITAIHDMYSYLNLMNYILPMFDILICFLLSLFLMAYSYIFRLVVWIGGLLVRLVSA